MKAVTVARIVLGAIGIAASGVFFVVVTLMTRSPWWMAIPCVIVCLALVQEWRYFIRAETGRTYRGVTLKPTAWWNFLGYYVFLGFLCFSFLAQYVWHLSNVKALIGMAVFVITLFSWVLLRIRIMPKLPKPTLPHLFLH